MTVRQLALDIGLSPAPDFESFIALGNEPVIRALQKMVEHPAGHSPVYLWGPSGSGKTHLLRAVEASARRAGHEVLWFDAACFTTDGQLPRLTDDAAHPGNGLAPWLILDQAESWTAPQQQAAFSAFVRWGSQGAAVLSAGRLPPVDLPIREDIRSRLGWGLVLSLWPLGESTLRQALQDQAQRRGLRLGDELLDYALRRLARDLKSLVGLLDRLDRYALQHQRALTVPLLRQMLDEEQGLN